MPRDQRNKTHCLTDGLRGDIRSGQFIFLYLKMFISTLVRQYTSGRNIQTYRGGKKKKASYF